MKKVVEKINETVFELWTGILIWGAVCQIIPVWFVSDKIGYSLGLWTGILLAGASAYHMWWALDRGLDDEGSAQGYIRKQGLIRYAVILAVFAVLMLTDAANPLSAFLGIMGLKAGAYLQPFLHKRLHTGSFARGDLARGEAAGDEVTGDGNVQGEIARGETAGDGPSDADCPEGNHKEKEVNL